MKTQSTRMRSSFLFSGAVAATLLVAAGCDTETEDADLADLEALEELEARSGGGGDGHDDGHDDGHHDDCHGDNKGPKITTRTLELWPPNHKMHKIDLEDCFVKVEECDPHWEAKILWVTSDEPEDDQTGDGNTEPDIECVDDDTVKLRAERKGNGDGRVYKIGFKAEDSKHNKSFGVCKVTVPHDQGHGAAVDSGEQLREHC
jgi:hypothetical protein